VIDHVQGGLWNLFERLSHGNLYHCRFCRVQFYDRRPLLSQASESSPPEATSGDNST
jgi:hypothetical protein